MSNGNGLNDYATEPFGDNDDFQFKRTKSFDKTSEEIGESNDQILVGVQLLRVVGLAEKPTPITKKVVLDGISCGYETSNLQLTLSNVENPEQSIRLFLQVPPEDPEQLKAYQFGSLPSDENPNVARPRTQGMAAKTFYNFIGAIGFDYATGELLPEAACDVRNWKNRILILTIDPPYQKKGSAPNKYNQIALYSCKKAGVDGAAPDGGKSALAAARSAKVAAPKTASSVAERKPLAIAEDADDSI